MDLEMDDSTIQPSMTRSLARSLSYKCPTTSPNRPRNRPLPLQRSCSEIIDDTEKSENVATGSKVIPVKRAVIFHQIRNKNKINRYVTRKYAANWKDIGIELGLKYSTLTIIESDHPSNCEDCFQAMINNWIESTSKNVTWEDLEVAVTNVIRQKLCLDPTDDVHIYAKIPRQEKIIEAVSEFYKKTFLKSKTKVYVIAALVCEHIGAVGDEEFKTVILTAGTKFKSTCTYTYNNYWGTCDGHAEAVCYQLASVYMIKEIHKLQQNRESIFKHALEGGYKLKENIKFHLFISQRPCGFMADKTIKCLLSWKNDFTKEPHILECSSKILIGTFLGIQGPLICLLVEPVYISSVVIAEHEKSKTDNVAPDEDNIEKHFKTFHENLQASTMQDQYHEFTMKTPESPDIIICKKNLYELFPSINPASIKKVPSKTPSHFTFQDHQHFIFQAPDGTVETLDINTDTKIISKHVKNLQSKANLSMICHQLKTYEKAIKQVSLALKINNAVEEEMEKTKQYLITLKKEIINIRVLINSCMTEIYTINVTGKASEDLGIQYHNSNYTNEESKENENRTVDLIRKYNNYKRRLEETSRRYNGYDAFKKRKYGSLFEIDCDWIKTMLKIKYIFNTE